MASPRTRNVSASIGLMQCWLKAVRYILAVGTGEWDGSIANPSNPQRRDVQIMPAGGYLV